ncbi:MAG: redoxin family protein, partial [Phycisphaerae bacterium]|nr:redoxin family protein [Phycisphaerae bacterium]
RARQLVLLTPAMLCLALGPIRASGQDQPVEQPSQPPTTQPDAPAAIQPEAQPAGNVDPAAKAILQAMSDAIAKATSIRANVKTTVTGSLSSVTPSTDAAVRLRKDGAAWHVRVTGSGTRNGQETNFDVAWGGGAISWLDHKEKKLVGRPQNEARGGSYAMASQAMPTQIIEVPPFNKELAGEEITHAGTEDVDAQACDLLHVRYPKRKTLLKLWIAQSDHMLRKLERSTETTKITSSTIQELTGVVLNQEVTDAELTITAPDGYASDVTTAPRFERGRRVPPPDESVGVITPPGATPDAASNGANSAQPATAPDTPAEAPLAMLPSVQLALSDGTTLATDSLRGKPAVFVFWGSWSLPSRDALEPICKFAAALKEPGVPVIACAVRERTKDAGAEFIRNYQPRNRTGDDRLDTGVLRVAGSGDELAKALSITRYPTLLAIDAQGRIAKRIEGFDPTKTIDELRGVVAP